jgi:hypothetical protein
MGAAIVGAKFARAGAAAAGKAKVPSGPLICVWEHDAKVDIAPIVRELGLNTLWAHDGPYNGKMEWKDTMMFRALEIPGLKYVLGKIDRKQWGWSYEAGATPPPGPGGDIVIGRPACRAAR